MTTAPHLRAMRSRIARTSARFVAHAAATGAQVADLPAMKLPWYEVRNDAGSADEPATILIFEEIGGSFGISSEQFAQDLLEIDASTIQVRINSPGGSLFEAIAIYNSLQHHPARIEVYVDAVAASAASIIAMAGQRITMMPGSQMMIHDCSTSVDGNPAELAKLSTWLDRQCDNAADIYRMRAGGEVSEWRGLMQAETWMFAQEAVDMGLADVAQPAIQPDRQADERMSRSFDLSGYRYAGRAAAPAPRRAAARQAPALSRASEGIRMQGNERAVSGDGPPMTGQFKEVEELLREYEQHDPGAPGDQSVRRPATERRAAAQQRGEAAQRRAHQLAQAGRRVPVLATSPEYRTQLRVVQAETPLSTGVVRVQGFKGRMQRAGTVIKGGRELVHLAGYASMYNQRYEMWDDFGPYEEFVGSGAGARSLAAKPDVAFLVNHRGVTMARTTNGTLELGEDSHGLANDAYVNGDRSDIQVLLTAVDDELVDEQSFTFMIVQGQWDDAFEIFGILEYDINRGDVSAVNYGANPFTNIAARSQEIIRAVDEMPVGMATAVFERLARRTDVAGSRMVSRQAVPAAERSAPQVTPVAPKPAGRRITHIEAMLDL